MSKTEAQNLFMVNDSYDNAFINIDGHFETLFGLRTPDVAGRNGGSYAYEAGEILVYGISSA